MTLEIICVFLILVIVAGGFYIAYLESKITKLKSEILGLKHDIILMKQKVNSTQMD